MPDAADHSLEEQQKELERGIAAARRDIPEGKSGYCDTFGEWSSRLISGECVACRNLAEIKHKNLYSL